MEIDLNLRAFDSERVACEGAAQLGHGAQVAGVQLGHLDGLAALHDGKMRQALLVAAGVVLDVGVVLDDAADDFEKADAAGEGIGHGLENHQGQRPAIVDFAGGYSGVGIVRCGFNCWIADGDGRALGGRGRVLLDEVEQVVEGHVA